MSSNGNRSRLHDHHGPLSRQKKQNFRDVMEELGLNESQGIIRLVDWVIANRRLPDDAPEDDAPTLPFGREEEPEEPESPPGSSASWPTLCGRLAASAPGGCERLPGSSAASWRRRSC